MCSERAARETGDEHARSQAGHVAASGGAYRTRTATRRTEASSTQEMASGRATHHGRAQQGDLGDG